uniref:NADH-ubiquinone oxidoreductase chain 6 n=1 Tax=Urostylis flavoannulata TaxID=2164054 RepID=A0A343W966_9HEMI|nr:NADH dehydrogenase subunit 6 [Urostylis flavoannulata]AVZ00906.1 NADH dehydrogenase subunit 6 [Urostylis flavoannulata]
MSTTIIMMIMMLSIMFLFTSHPLSMTIILITQTLLISLITGMIMSTFLMSYIILIIMISGMLVLFIYMASIASNEKFKITLSLSLLMIMFMLMMLMIDIDPLELTIKTFYDSKESFMLIKMFNYPVSVMIVSMVMFLFLTMISVSNIINVSMGPLRTKIYE